MRYIDYKTQYHSYEEHMKVVDELLRDGYRYVGRTYNNPCFYSEEKKESVCILASVITQSGYFSYE